MKKKIGIVITDGVGFRNFVISDFIIESKKSFTDVIIYSCIPLSSYEEYNLNVKIVELPEFIEKFPTWFFRKIKEVAHLQKYEKNNFGIKDNLKANYSRSNNLQGFATRFIFGITKKFHSEKNILSFNKLQQFTYKFYKVSTKLTAILEKDKVDILFFTHQRPPFIAPLIYQAKKMEIKTAAFIFSWDNLASKGRMAGNFDYYLVWSNLMKQELLYFYESVKQTQIEVVGTPQFEPYILDRYKTPKEVYYKKFKLDENYSTLCFSCGDISTSKNDELYISTIAKFIIENQLIKKINFIVRTSPAENGDRFDEIKKKYNFIIWNYPKWKLARNNHQELWSQRIPTEEDVKDLRGLLEYSDVFVNMLSTMSLDAMIFDKPVINPAFGNKENGLYDDQRFLYYKHIKHVLESGAVSLVKNDIEMLNAINIVLDNSKIKLIEQKKLIQLEVGKPLFGTSERLAKKLLEWS